MLKRKKLFLVAGLLLAWFAVITQYYLMLQNRVAPVTETTIRFFSFYTILTNTLVALFFTVTLIKQPYTWYVFFQKSATATAITVYITIVGLVYQLVLRGTWRPQGMQLLVDELLHTVIPVYFIIYWILIAKKYPLRWLIIPKWLLYPLIYLIYILARGKLSGFFPYPFVDIHKLGFQKVIINSLVLLGVFILFSLFYIFIGKIVLKKPLPRNP